MNKKLSYRLLALCCIWNTFYILVLLESLISEYFMDKFYYWGYPQWGRLYSSPRFFLWFNIFYILLLSGAMIFSWIHRHSDFRRAFLIAIAVAVISIANMHVSEYNRNHQFKVMKAEQGEDGSRIPAGTWIVGSKTLQSYADQGLMNKIKGWWGRGDWPGGLDIWGQYRVWLLPHTSTDTQNRRGLVIHGGNKQKSPWGINMGDEIIGFAERLKSSDAPLELEINYDN